MFKVYHEDFNEGKKEVFSSEIYIDANQYAKRYVNDLLDEMDETTRAYFTDMVYDECYIEDSAGLQHKVSVRYSN